MNEKKVVEIIMSIMQKSNKIEIREALVNHYCMHNRASLDKVCDMLELQGIEITHCANN
jgi:hypothetical protein